MKDYLVAQVAERDRRIAEIDQGVRELQRLRVVAVAERGAYQDALEHLPAGPDAGTDSRKHGRPGVRSSAWREVYEFIARRWPESATNDQMMAYALTHNLTFTRQALRAQLSTYTEKGSLERVDNGVYRITQRGANELGIALGGQVEEPEDHQLAWRLENEGAEEAPEGEGSGDSEAGEDQAAAQSDSLLDQPQPPARENW